MTINYVTLRFPSYEVAEAAAKQLGFWDNENNRLNTAGQTIRADGSAFSWGIDEIGLVVETPAIIDPETGEVIEEATYKDGYYVNATGELPAEVEPFLVPYGSGGRIFAGTEELVGI